MSGRKKKQAKKESSARKHIWNTRRICLATGCALLLACAVGMLLFLRASQCLTVCTINGHPVTQAELHYCYIEQIASYQDKTRRFGGDGAAGPDLSRPLSKQSCPLTSGISWQDYFMNAALRQLRIQIASADQAESEGFIGGGMVEEALKLRLEAIEAAAEEAGLSTQQYLQERYGSHVTMELIREIELRSILSARYLAAAAWDQPLNEDALEARFSENRRWNMTASYLIVPLDCSTAEQEQAAAALAEADGQKDFLSRCAGYCRNDPADRAVLHTEAAAGEMEDYTVLEWVLDETRQPGDTAVVSLYDELTNQSGLSALYFLNAQRNSRETYTYQEILLAPDPVGSDGTSRCWGAKRVDTLESDLMDEESFGTMALAYSTLASANRLGLRTSDAGELSGLPYAEWLVDRIRKSGDISMFETEYGVYLIRYIGQGSVYWRNNIENALRSEAEEALSQELEENAEVKNGLLFFWLT